MNKTFLNTPLSFANGPHRLGVVGFLDPTKRPESFAKQKSDRKLPVAAYVKS